MRFLYIDIDSLRPDHLGCYGYHRETSPHIDRIAGEGVRFNNCYVSDAPCLPSRTALFSGRCGAHTGVVNHGGKFSEMFPDGESRQFRNTIGTTSWMAALRQAGYWTATISPFGERHSAFHWYSGFNEILNTGEGGNELAETVAPHALDWLRRKGASDNWFLHVNFWDPHTPYRTPESWKNEFADDPIPEWYTEEVRQEHWSRPGPMSSREIRGYSDYTDEELPEWVGQYKRQPLSAENMEKSRMMFDGYDMGVRYADYYVGQLINVLEAAGVLDETVIMISADHGENLGELNIYGDHQTADHITSRVPLIVRWPGITNKMAGTDRNGFLYAYDFAATLLELAGAEVPANWDGRSFAQDFKAGNDQGRDDLVLSQAAWCTQRSVRWDDYICIRTYQDAFHGFPEVMLFNLAEDPHEQHNLAEERPDLVAEAMKRLSAWQDDMMRTASHPVDPVWGVIQEGGGLHGNTRQGPSYLKRLEATGRGEWAEHFRKLYNLP